MSNAPRCPCLRARTVPRTLISITRSISSSVVSSKVFGIAVPALFTSTSSWPKVATVFSTARNFGIAATGWVRRRSRFPSGKRLK
jgi:hypothetical protein